MKYERFEQLPVWQAAIDLAAAVYAMTEKACFQRRYSLRDQIERAVVSISNNIAEGFERGTKQELLTFLYIARGSSGELRSMLCLLQKIPAFADLESGILNLKSRGESISKQLGAWIRSLKDSQLKGQRYVTEKVRRQAERAREREEFVKELEAIRQRGSQASGPESGRGSSPESGIRNSETGPTRQGTEPAGQGLAAKSRTGR